MKKLFIYLLRIYSKIEKDRLEIIHILDDELRKDYSEQTPFGNVYNHYIEFLISNEFIIHLVNKKDSKSLFTIKRGLHKTFDEAIEFIKNEK